MLKLTLLTVLACTSIALATTLHETVVRFDNYRVYNVRVANAEQLRELQRLEHVHGWQFWRSADRIGSEVDVMVAPSQVKIFEQLAERVQLEASVKIENVQSLIDNEQPATRSTTYGWSSYYNLDGINQWVDEQIAQYPNLLTNYVVGKSYENRTIRAVKLSHKAGNPTIFIEANIHAREWITSATATWLLNQLLTSNATEVQDLAQNFDWIIVPVFNVDGFAYTHRVNRMWRKTRQPHGRICYGADPNRNFDAHWMEIGASSNICSETYAGPRAFSEPETKALADFVAGLPSGSVKLYLALHSYGQYFMFPLGYSSVPTPDYELQMAVAQRFKEAAAQRFGTTFRVGPSSTTIYPTSGSSQDWVYDATGTKLSFTVEFRDLGRYGFLLPPEQIVENGAEFLDGVLAVVKEGRSRGAL